MARSQRIALVYLIVAIVGVFALQHAWRRATAAASIPYSEFQELVRRKRVRDLVISADEIRGELLEPVDGKSQFVTIRVAPELADELRATGVRYTQLKNHDAAWSAALSWFLPMVFFLGLWFFVIRRMAERGGAGGVMAIGKSKAKVYVETDTKVSFVDVAGVDEAKEELQEIVSFLKNPRDYSRLGAHIPKGVLLVGPPGTGKTLLARAVAGEAGVPFFSISGSEFVELFVGVGAARVRDLFEQARLKAPAIVFIDELDALGRARNMGGHDEKEQTLNQLLVELDGFDTGVGIVLLAATNRPETLDPALLRAGRFDRQVLLDRPDRHGRRQILDVHLTKIRLAPSLDAEKIAQLTPGFTGADLANLVNEAALLATRRRGECVALDDFTHAIERIVAGLEKKNRLLNPREREVVAHHELGHALVASQLPGSDQVHKISIIPRGVGSLGYTIQRPTEDRYLMTRVELENKMAILLGGRAAEDLAFKHLSTGAADDLAKATQIARSMVTRYGMAPTLGHVTYEQEPSSMLGPTSALMRTREYSEETAREIDCAVRELVNGAYRSARAVLERHRALLSRGAEQLLALETLNEDQVRALFADVVPVASTVAAA